MESSEINTQLEKLKIKIPYNEIYFVSKDTYEKVLNDLLEDSKYIGLSLRFPYEDYSDMELPKKYENWQIRCCVELYNLVGKENIVSYSENGVSWKKDSSMLSPSLRNEIKSKVGVPKDEE